MGKECTCIFKTKLNANVFEVKTWTRIILVLRSRIIYNSMCSRILYFGKWSLSFLKTLFLKTKNNILSSVFVLL